MDAHTILMHIQELYDVAGRTTRYEISKEMFGCRMSEGSSVNDHVLKMINLIERLGQLGFAMDGELSQDLVLQSLPSSNPKKRKRNSSKKKKVGEKTPVPPKAEDPKSKVVCFFYNKVGHWKRNCKVYLAELKKKGSETTASDSGMFMIEGPRRSRTFEEEEVILLMGNGARVAAEDVESFHLHRPTGKTIVLNNCYFVPSIVRNIIPMLDLAGFSFIIENNECSILSDNILYGRVEKNMDDSEVPQSKVRAKVPVELNRTSRSFKRYRDSQIEKGTNDYKIIRVVPVREPDFKPYSLSRVEIYSANSNSWTDVDSDEGFIPFCPKLPNCNFIIRGCPYWVGVDRPDDINHMFLYKSTSFLGRLILVLGRLRRPLWYEPYSHVESLVCVKGMELIGKEDKNKKKPKPAKNCGRTEMWSKDFESLLHINYWKEQVNPDFQLSPDKS
ncbi:hypothetical protein AgCh_009487 [Apium graveolens]